MGEKRCTNQILVSVLKSLYPIFKFKISCEIWGSHHAVLRRRVTRIDTNVMHERTVSIIIPNEARIPSVSGIRTFNQADRKMGTWLQWALRSCKTNPWLSVGGNDPPATCWHTSSLLFIVSFFSSQHVQRSAPPTGTAHRRSHTS